MLSRGVWHLLGIWFSVAGHGTLVVEYGSVMEHAWYSVRGYTIFLIVSYC